MKIWARVGAAFLVLLLAACSMAELVQISPSETPQPSATVVTNPETTGTRSVCDNMVFIADTTIPDFTPIMAGQNFVKTWKIKNTGSCAWKTGYVLAWSWGDSKMGGETTALATEVAPNKMTQISVSLKGPVKPGSYHGYWRLQNSAGYRFGEALSLVIVVP